MPRPVAWLALGVFLNRAGFFAVPMLLLYLTKERGLSADEAGIELALYAAGALASAVGGGWMTDGIGRRATMLTSLFGAGTLWILVFAIPDPRALGALLFATGFAADLYRAAASTVVADICPVALRPRAYSIIRRAGNAGFAFGPALAGVLAERSFALVFLGESLTCLAFGVIVLAKIAETRPSDAVPKEPLAGLGRVLSDRVFLLVCFANLLVVSVYVQQLSTLALYVVEVRGLTPRHHGLLLSLNGTLVVVCEFLVVRRARRLRPLIAIALGSAVIGAGFGLLSFASGFIALAACAAVWTLGEMIAWPLLPDWVVSRAPVAMRGRFLGFTGLSSGIALLAGVGAGPWIARRFGAETLWSGCAGVCLVAALLVAGLALRERGRRGEAGAGSSP